MDESARHLVAQAFAGKPYTDLQPGECEMLLVCARPVEGFLARRETSPHRGCKA
jgi:hypothetical protein